jgi:hypothetical protein
MPLESGQFAWEPDPETKFESDTPNVSQYNPQNYNPEVSQRAQAENNEGLASYLFRNLVQKAPKYGYQLERGGMTGLPVRSTMDYLLPENPLPEPTNER